MRLPLIALATAALALAGCSDSGEENDGVLTETTGSGGSGQTVVMRDIEFQPKIVKVQAGETVTWVNEDSAPHNAVAKDRGALRTKTIQKGERVTFTPQRTGRIDYVCTIHPGMEGTLDVVDA